MQSSSSYFFASPKLFAAGTERLLVAKIESKLRRAAQIANPYYHVTTRRPTHDVEGFASHSGICNFRVGL
jgi:hypothetical protein